MQITVLEGNSAQGLGFYKYLYTFKLIKPDSVQESAFSLIKRNKASTNVIKHIIPHIWIKSWLSAFYK